MIDHSQLSKFRSNLSFSQQVNVLVYILHHFNQSGLLGDCVLHAVDSTELANDRRIPLATVKIKGKKIRIYNDLDCDCGKRRINGRMFLLSNLFAISLYPDEFFTESAYTKKNNRINNHRLEAIDCLV